MNSSPLFEQAETSIPGCYRLLPRVHADARGLFVKTYHSRAFEDLGLPTRWAEDFWSSSREAVLRGLHFQRPPHSHAKLVTCLRGRVLDALVDLRLGSPAYGRHELLNLDEAHPAVLVVAAGVAHGFQVLSEEALVLYKTGTMHVPEADDGILWNSCGINWPRTPLLSERDATFQTLTDYLAKPLFRFA